MQHHGDRPVRGGRPSLLASEEPAAAPERPGILSSLDGLKAPAAPARAAPERSRRWAWGGAAVGAVVVVGAALFVFAQEEGDERHAPTLAAAAPVPAAAPTPAAAPSAALVAVAAVQAAPVEPAANAAAAPVVAVAPPQPAAPAASAAAAPGVPVPTGAAAPAVQQASAPAVVRDVAPAPLPNPLADLAPSPSSAGERKAGAHETAHPAPDSRAQDRHAAAKRTEERQAAPKRKTHAQDNDVVLLMALMNHIDPKTRKATPAEQLETCKRYNAAGEEQCRIRVCAAAGRKEPACRHVPAQPPGSAPAN